MQIEEHQEYYESEPLMIKIAPAELQISACFHSSLLEQMAVEKIAALAVLV